MGCMFVPGGTNDVRSMGTDDNTIIGHAAVVLILCHHGRH